MMPNWRDMEITDYKVIDPLPRLAANFADLRSDAS